MKQKLATIPVAVPDLRGNELAYLTKCIEDNWVSSVGPFVREMEKRIATLTGCRYGIATVNGTTGIQLALSALGIGAGDHVLVPDWTFCASANAIFHAGAQPYFVDISRESWTIDDRLVSSIINESKIRISAVIVVHALGHPANLGPLKAVCQDANVKLIEDAAGALGATYKGNPVGSFGDCAVFSFNGNKTITAGGGGMVVTNNTSLANKMSQLSSQARKTSEYKYEDVGFNFRMTNLNAAVGLAQLERLDEMLVAKRTIAESYDLAIAGRSDIMAMPRCGWAESSKWLYAVLCSSKNDATSLVSHLKTYSIESNIFWLSLSGQPPYANCMNTLNGVSEDISNRVVILPCSSSLSSEDQIRVITSLREWRGSKLIS